MVSNKEYIGTAEAANILQISPSTVRRLAEDGTLECVRIGKSKYRKFKKESVLRLQKEYYGVSTVSKKEETSDVINQNIVANPHPAHYLMHKYWGRKPHNVVSTYIENFTKEGDIVLEPFMGSGVTVIEAIKIKRRAIGFDINPMSKFIVDNTISNVDMDLFSVEYTRVMNTVREKFGKLYITKCPICGDPAIIETAVWEIDTICRLKGICKRHKTFIKDVDREDVSVYEQATHIKNTVTDIWYPTDNIMKYVKRSGRNRIDELFSDRALVILSEIRKQILDVADEKCRSLLLFCFTSALSNVSRMLPGDLEKVTYKSGWVISKFWTPKIHTERNVFLCFDLRYKAIVKGKGELAGVDSSLAEVEIRDSSNMSSLEDESIDYIFTDPPYGESIAYLALSQFWNSWIAGSVDYENEIIIDPYRNKGYEDYSERVRRTYAELYRVLKTDHYMSFTFHNRDMNVWKAILDACQEAGFELESIVLQEQAVSSGTQGINRKNTLTGDFVYNFKKKATKKKKVYCNNNPRKFVEETIKNYIDNNGGATPSELYEYLIPQIVRNNAYTDKDGNIISIENILKQNYEYVASENNTKLGGAYKWIQRCN